MEEMNLFKKQKTDSQTRENKLMVTKGEKGERGINWEFGLYVYTLSSVAQSCPTLCDPTNCSMPGFPVPHYLLEFAKTHVHCVDDTIQPSQPL